MDGKQWTLPYLLFLSERKVVNYNRVRPQQSMQLRSADKNGLPAARPGAQKTACGEGKKKPEASSASG